MRSKFRHQKRTEQRVRDNKTKGPASSFDKLRQAIARRRERLSLRGRARRILGARKFERGTKYGQEKARRKRNGG